MKSSLDDLKKRGFVENIEENYLNLSYKALIGLLQSTNACERTIAVRLLGRNKILQEAEVTNILLGLLIKEKGLYTKIEICNVMEKSGVETASKMTKLLGKIGTNQYRCLPNSVSKKISYPLPRDIIARTLGKMSVEIMSVMLEVLNQGDIYAIREVIDAIGYMCFYNTVSNKHLVIESLMKCYNNFKDDDIVRWKIIMACSAFRNESIASFLQKVRDTDKEALIRNEAKRSLKLISAT